MHCDALHWIDERLARSSQSNPSFSTCCNQGKVCIPQLLDPPQALWDLFTSNDAQCNEFQEHIRQYNMALAFTSLGVKEDTHRGAGSSVFLVNSAICQVPPYLEQDHHRNMHNYTFTIHSRHYNNKCTETATFVKIPCTSCRLYCLDTTVMPQYTNMLMKFSTSTRIPPTSQYAFT